MIDLSIVFGTYNRRQYLNNCLNSIYRSLGNFCTEIIVVDGMPIEATGFYNGPLNLFYRQIPQGGLLGCVDAYNKGFARARGKYVAFINDDVTVENDALTQSVEMLDNNPDIGMVAIPYENPGRPRQVAYCNAGNPSKKYLFACFGVLRRELGERAGWFDGFYHYCGDLHLSMSIWKMGYRVEELKTGGYIKHYEAPNPYRDKKTMEASAKQKIKGDFRLFSEKWGHWDGTIEERNEKLMVEDSFKSSEELPEE